MSCPQGKRLGIPPSAFCLASEEYRLRVERVYRVLLVQLAAVGTSVTSYRTRDYVPLSLSHSFFFAVPCQGARNLSPEGGLNGLPTSPAGNCK